MRNLVPYNVPDNVQSIRRYNVLVHVSLQIVSIELQAKAQGSQSLNRANIVSRIKPQHDLPVEMPTPREITKRGPVTVHHADVKNWKVHDVSSWLMTLGGAYRMYVPVFKAKRINGERLLTLKNHDLRALGVTFFLHELGILGGIQSLQQKGNMRSCHKQVI